MSYMTISSQENYHFSLCSYFHAHPTTLLLKILGEPMRGPSPHLKFFGGRPPFPSRSPPLSVPMMRSIHEQCILRAPAMELSDQRVVYDAKGGRPPRGRGLIKFGHLRSADRG